MKAINAEEFAQICFDIAKDQKGQGNYANALLVSELGKMISTYPTVDAAPVAHGRWMNMKNGNADCSICLRHVIGVYDDDNADKFCRCCGAKMDLEGKDAAD